MTVAPPRPSGSTTAETSCRPTAGCCIGHHFAAIAGAGPLVGPVLAAQFGFLPGTLWLVIGVVVAGAVQDFTILFCSLRRDGKSLGQMAKEEVNALTGIAAMVAVLMIMIILLAVLALIVVNALQGISLGPVHHRLHRSRSRC